MGGETRPRWPSGQATRIVHFQAQIGIRHPQAGGERSVNAVWTYEAPYATVSAIREYLAFYPDRVDAIEVRVED